MAKKTVHNVQARAFLSPRNLAAAVGVSESSVKRWADEGRIRTALTPGGSRRIQLREAVHSPLLMTLLLTRVSGVTLLEQKLRVARPAYADYVARTNAFVPWFPRTISRTGERS